MQNQVYKPLNEITEINELFVSEVSCRDEGEVDCDFEKVWTIRFTVNGERHKIHRWIKDDVGEWHNYDKLSPARHLDLTTQMMGRISFYHKWGDTGELHPDFENTSYYRIYQKLINIDIDEYAIICNHLFIMQPIRIINENVIEYNSERYEKKQ